MELVLEKIEQETESNPSVGKGLKGQFTPVPDLRHRGKITVSDWPRPACYLQQALDGADFHILFTQFWDLPLDRSQSRGTQNKNQIDWQPENTNR